MALHLVTGYQGKAHITSADQGLYNALMGGTGDYVLAHGKQFKAEVVNDTNVRILDGCALMNGRFIVMDADTNQNIPLNTGTAGTNRNDIIALRYHINRSTGVETVEFVKIQGTHSSGTPTDPTITYPNSILLDADYHDMPLYRVVIRGTTLTRVEQLFTVLAPMSDFHHGFYNQNLLINGDFQCNQRGEKSYSVANVTGGKYTVDMWRAYQVKVDVLAESAGVKVTGLSTTEQGYFTQFIQLGKLETKSHTISAMVDGKLCVYTETAGASAKEKSFGTFKISVLTTSTWDNAYGGYNNKLKVNICPIGTNSITISYIDVFEGNVAYPHRREDPATALMRCRQYIQAGFYTSPILWRATADQSIFRHTIAICFDKMSHTEKTQPQLEKATMAYVPYNSTDGSTTSTYLGADPDDSATLTDANGMFTVKFHGEVINSTYADGVKGRYVITCEPRDN